MPHDDKNIYYPAIHKALQSSFNWLKILISLDLAVSCDPGLILVLSTKAILASCRQLVPVCPHTTYTHSFHFVTPCAAVNFYCIPKAQKANDWKSGLEGE
jgi:hypothetical protein